MGEDIGPSVVSLPQDDGGFATKKRSFASLRMRRALFNNSGKARKRAPSRLSPQALPHPEGVKRPKDLYEKSDALILRAAGPKDLYEKKRCPHPVPRENCPEVSLIM
jgi:hypothetical protein